MSYEGSSLPLFNSLSYTIKKLEFKKLEWRLGCKTCIVYTGLYNLGNYSATSPGIFI